MVFESGSLPLDTEECCISISTVSSQDCVLPTDGLWVSGVYKIDCSNKFNKPVSIKIQHCIAKNSLQNVIFVTSSDKTSPYEFRCVQSNIKEGYGEIQASSFSLFGMIRSGFYRMYSGIFGQSDSQTSTSVRPTSEIAHNTSSDSTSMTSTDVSSGALSDHVSSSSGLQYSIYLYYLEQINVQIRASWKLFFFVVRNMELTKTSVDNFADRHKLKHSSTRVVEPNESDKCVSFQPQSNIAENIRFTDITEPSVRMTIINRYEGGAPPSYELKLQLNSSTYYDDELEVKFNIIGCQNSHEHMLFLWPPFGK